jgi:inosose dehydratase
MVDGLKLGSGPVSFGVDFADAPGNPPWRTVLDGIAAAGFGWTELGPIGYLPEDLAPELEARGLGLTAGFVFEPLHEPRRRADNAVVARAVCERVASMGGRFLVVIDAVSPDRARTAGRPEVAARLDRGAAARMRSVIQEIARIAEGWGLRPVLHAHAGTYIEFEDEVEPLLDTIELCLDTGHWLYAGEDPVRVYERWADRIPYLHLKDLDGERRDGDFWGSVRAGVFRPIGEGDLDVRAFVAALERHGFEGWAIVEQDRVPGGDPIADLVASREHLEGRKCG